MQPWSILLISSSFSFLLICCQFIVNFCRELCFHLLPCFSASPIFGSTLFFQFFMVFFASPSPNLSSHFIYFLSWILWTSLSRSLFCFFLLIINMLFTLNSRWSCRTLVVCISSRFNLLNLFLSIPHTPFYYEIGHLIPPEIFMIQHSND